MIGYSFRDLARDVLRSTRKPMSAEQIWSEADSLGIAEKVGSKGKTPWRSIQAQLYMDIKDSSDSDFVQLRKHPVLFGLKSLSYGEWQVESASDDVNDGDDASTTGAKKPKSQWGSGISTLFSRPTYAATRTSAAMPKPYIRRSRPKRPRTPTCGRTQTWWACISRSRISRKAPSSCRALSA